MLGQTYQESDHVLRQRDRFTAQFGCSFVATRQAGRQPASESTFTFTVDALGSSQGLFALTQDISRFMNTFVRHPVYLLEERHYDLLLRDIPLTARKRGQVTVVPYTPDGELVFRESTGKPWKVDLAADTLMDRSTADGVFYIPAGFVSFNNGTWRTHLHPERIRRAFGRDTFDEVCATERSVGRWPQRQLALEQQDLLDLASSDAQAEEERIKQGTAPAGSSESTQGTPAKAALMAPPTRK